MSGHLGSFCKKAKQVLSNDRGQGLVEYALILVLIALVAVAAMTTLGGKVNNTFTTVNNRLP
jgi:pilus assembly protein Flp/PilA